jgi:hypothetical protein
MNARSGNTASRLAAAALALSFGTLACSSEENNGDAGTDAGPVDSGQADAGQNDAGTDSGVPGPDEVYTAHLSQAQEVPPTGAAFEGMATLNYFHDGGMLQYVVEHDGGAVVALGHIHRGQAGINGPVIHPFTAVTSPISGTFVLDGGTAGADYQDLSHGRLYVNLHQTGGGFLVRGQILRPGEKLYVAQLLDLGNSNADAGAAAFVLSGDAGTVSWNVTINIDPADAVNNSHIHRRSDSQVILPTPGTANDGGSGTAASNAATITELEADNAYFNVHTASMPGGRVQGDTKKLP